MYIVIGANGYIGSYIVKNILHATDDEVFAIGRHIDMRKQNRRVYAMKCDLTVQDDIERLNREMSHMHNTKIIYLAAYHHPDEVKRNPKTAWNMNVTVLSDVLNRLDHVDHLIYASTEMVYGAGSVEHKFVETEELHPVNLYGVQKKVAEAVVSGHGFHVVRLPFVIGPGLLEDRRHFYDIIVENISNGQEIEMFEDAYKTALDFDTLSELIVRLCEKGARECPPILNIAGDRTYSKYEIGIEIAKKHHLDTRLIKPVRMNQKNGIFTETRAGCTLLDNSLLKKVLHLNEIRMKF